MDRSDRHYLKRSLAVSAGLHLMLVPLLIATMPALLGADLSATAAAFSDREAVTTVSYLSIEHRARPKARPVAAPVRAVPPPPAPPRLTTVSAAPQHITVPRLSVGRRAHVPQGPVRSVAAVFEAAAPARRNVKTANSAEQPAVAAPVPALAATPAPASSATPVAAAALADASSPRVFDVPQGGWGQNFERPIVADDAALADLRSRYHDVPRVSVEVDDSGHATHVFLPNGLADDERAELERRLMALRYVPAECNGLHCAGTLQLILQ